MNTWSELKLPYIFERMVGFSQPMANNVAIVAYDGIHLLNLDRSEVFRQDFAFPEGGNLYDSLRGRLSYRGVDSSILGLHGGSPIHQSESGERLELDLATGILRVRDRKGAVSLEFSFEDLSGDWGHVTFSPDYSYILLGLPYDLHVFRRSHP